MHFKEFSHSGNSRNDQINHRFFFEAWKYEGLLVWVEAGEKCESQQGKRVDKTKTVGGNYLPV